MATDNLAKIAHDAFFNTMQADVEPTYRQFLCDREWEQITTAGPDLHGLNQMYEAWKNVASAVIAANVQWGEGNEGSYD